MAKSNRFDDVNERFEDVLKERNDMIKSERIYRKRIKQLEEELKGMVSQCQVLSDENKELRKALDTKQTGDSFESLNSMTKLAQIETEKANLEAEKNYKVKLDSLNDENTKIGKENLELESKVRDLEKQASSLANEKKSLESAKRQEEADVKIIQDLRATVEDLQNENKIMETKIKSLEYDNTNLNISIENKRKKFSELTRTLQTEARTETDLKDTKEKLEIEQKENNRIREELMNMQKILTDAEMSIQKLHEQLDEKDHTTETAKMGVVEKDKLIIDLRKDLDLSNHEIMKLEESQQIYKTMETETHGLKSRIDSLKIELDNSLVENHKLKQDKEEMIQTIDTLRQESSDGTEAVRDSDKYLRNWEHEKEYRLKVEADLMKKNEQVQILEQHVKEAENKMTELNNRLLSLEQEKIRLGNCSISQLESDNQVLKEGNMKLRQMLVERNIELTNTKHEQTISDFLIRDLDIRTRQKKTVRVQKLSQSEPQKQSITSNQATEPITRWQKIGHSNNVIKRIEDDKLSTRTNQTNVTRQNKNSEFRGGHIQVVGVDNGTQSHRNGLKRSTHRPITPSIEEPNKLGGEERTHTTTSLPVLETKSVMSARLPNGYFTLYKDRQKRFQEKRY